MAEIGVKIKLKRMPFGVVAFDRDTVLRLRREYRIIGSMAGCHPSVPHQNKVRSVPLLLMDEEATLLRELEVAEFSGEWLYPDTDREKLCYQVYRFLWRAGYYLTDGCRFGGNYLAYPDDPIKVHSTHIVVVKERSQQIQPTDLIGGGRLANTTKKNLLYATMDEKGNPLFVSVKWSGLVGGEKY